VGKIDYRTPGMKIFGIDLKGRTLEFHCGDRYCLLQNIVCSF